MGQRGPGKRGHVAITQQHVEQPHHRLHLIKTFLFSTNIFTITNRIIGKNPSFFSLYKK